MLKWDGSGGTDRKTVQKISAGKQCGKNPFCHGRTTDIFITDENNSDCINHIFHFIYKAKYLYGEIWAFA